MDDDALSKTVHFDSVSLKSCQKICIELYNEYCTSAIYDKEKKKCYITQYDVSRNLSLIFSITATCYNNYFMFRRNRCLSNQINFFCIKKMLPFFIMFYFFRNSRIDKVQLRRKPMSFIYQ